MRSRLGLRLTGGYVYDLCIAVRVKDKKIRALG